MNGRNRDSLQETHFRHPLTNWMQPIVAALLTTLLVLRLALPPEGGVLGESLWLTWGVMLLVFLLVSGWWSATLPFPQWGGVDLSLLLLFLGHWLGGGIVFLGSGDRRTALNLLLEWIGVAAGWLAIRTVLAIPQARGVLVRGILAILLIQAGLGIWQNSIGHAQLSREYLQLRAELDRLEAISAKTPDVTQSLQRAQQKLLQAGLQPHMLSGSGRSALEARLLSSSEALGRCSLANTLAGLLLPAWILMGGSLFRSFVQWRRSTDHVRSGLSLGLQFVFWVMVSYALLLTKSRTAYVSGAIVGLILLFVEVLRSLPTRRSRLFVIAGALLLMAVIGVTGFATGGIDRFVWEEAPKSLKYRSEYWQGAWKVICEAPLCGVGLGQFRQHYLLYKLPESSEEILDPHNMLLDVWANGGLLGLLGLLGVIFFVLRNLYRSLIPAPGLSEPHTALEPVAIKSSSAVPFVRPEPFWNQLAWISGLVGFLSFYIATSGLDQELLLIGGCWIALVCGGPLLFGPDLNAERSTENNACQTPICLWSTLALVAVGIHLLGAGGIGMSTPVLIWLVFLGVILPGSLPVSGETVPQGWSGRLFFAMLLMVTVCSGACFIWGCLPVRNSSAWMNLADYSRSGAERLLKLRNAAQADPLAPDPWGAISITAAELWGRDPAHPISQFETAVSAAKEAIQRDPLNSTRYRQLAALYGERARREKSPELARKGLVEYKNAIARYPYRADLLADAAETASLAEDASSAGLYAKRALELDHLNRGAGHSDKYLDPSQLIRLRKISEMGTPDASVNQSPRTEDPGK